VYREGGEVGGKPSNWPARMGRSGKRKELLGYRIALGRGKKSLVLEGFLYRRVGRIRRTREIADPRAETERGGVSIG